MTQNVSLSHKDLIQAIFYSKFNYHFVFILLSHPIFFVILQEFWTYKNRLTIYANAQTFSSCLRRWNRF